MVQGRNLESGGGGNEGYHSVLAWVSVCVCIGGAWLKDQCLSTKSKIIAFFRSFTEQQLLLPQPCPMLSLRLWGLRG